MKLKIILTDATGLVGEGVLLTCLEHPSIEQVLMVNRRPYALQHAKLRQCLVPDFMQLDGVREQFKGYDACFYCAGISSAGMNEADYTRVTYDTPLHFAKVLADLNPQMILCHISGGSTDSSEKGRVMWARVKGKAENALMKLPFKKVYNFRPGFMKPMKGQRNVKGVYKVLGALAPAFFLLAPNYSSTVQEVGLAMTQSVRKGAPKQVLEVADFKALAHS